MTENDPTTEAGRQRSEYDSARNDFERLWGQQPTHEPYGTERKTAYHWFMLGRRAIRPDPMD